MYSLGYIRDYLTNDCACIFIVPCFWKERLLLNTLDSIACCFHFWKNLAGDRIPTTYCLFSRLSLAVARTIRLPSCANCFSVSFGVFLLQAIAYLSNQEIELLCSAKTELSA